MHMNRFMRLIVFFDLPVVTKLQRQEATRFRNFLLKDGYYMIQYSVYVRICNGYDAVRKHENRLYEWVPKSGAIRSLIITEKQYESMKYILGKPVKKDEKKSDKEDCMQLSFF